jgi:hypothetical protein
VALCPAAIREQERAGLDIITDGEIRRTSAIVPGQVFPINISQKIHTVPFGINYLRWRRRGSGPGAVGLSGNASFFTGSNKRPCLENPNMVTQGLRLARA